MKKNRIFCWKCDEWDGVKYLGHDLHELYFVCDYCYEKNDPHQPLQIMQNKEWHIPNHIPMLQWDKYIAKTIYIRNWRWYET